MHRTAALLLCLAAFPCIAQTTSTLCQAKQVLAPGTNVTELQLIGCGEGYPDNLLWNLDRADSPAGTLDAKVTRTGTGKGAVVYVVDTGVMRDHDEFARPDGSAVIGAIYAPGLVDTTCSKDPALDPRCSQSDPMFLLHGHGTAVASVIAGQTVGVAPDAKIVSVYMLPAQGLGAWVSTLDRIIAHAWDPATPAFDAAIINMSFIPTRASLMDSGVAAFETKMRQMIDGVDRNGQPDSNGKKFLFVVIAGNYGECSTCGPAARPSHCAANMDTDVYPAVLGASIDGLITVGGIDRTNHLWERSCRGAAVDILAPAADVLVASIGGSDRYRSGVPPPGDYPMNSGTSFAAPYVAGLAALLLEKDPTLTPRQLEARIKQMASRVANIDEPTASGLVAIFDFPRPTPPRRRAAGR